MNSSVSFLAKQLCESSHGVVVEVRGADAGSVLSECTLAIAQQCAGRKSRFISFVKTAEEVRVFNNALVAQGLPPSARLLNSPIDVSILADVSLLFLTHCSPREAFTQFALTPLNSNATIIVDECQAIPHYRYGAATELISLLEGNKICFELKDASDGKRMLIFRNPGSSLCSMDLDSLEDSLHTLLFEATANRKPGYPADRFQGRGIVVCAGGRRYFTNAWICAHILRHLGCKLPIQFWHLGDREMTDEMRQLVSPLDVECVDAFRHPNAEYTRTLNGWELKPFSVIHSPFREVLFLDADNVTVRNPEFLFESREYRETGAVFWPDFSRLGADRTIWKVCGVPFRDEPEFETGQILIDKERCWDALHLTMHMNEYSDFYYRHIHGDKETFHLAWRKLDQPYSMPLTPIRHLDGCTMVQHDFVGQPLFQHRNMRKWTLDGRNDPVGGFALEDQCILFLEDLRRKWSEARNPSGASAQGVRTKIGNMTMLYVRVGHDYRELEFLPDGRIGRGAAGMEALWHVVESPNGTIRLRIGNDQETTCYLSEDDSGTWQGKWESFEKMAIKLIPLRRRG